MVVILGAGAVAGGLGFYKYAEIKAATAAAAAAPEAAEAVEAVRVRSGHWTASARAVGTVVALRQVEIRNELAGTIAAVAFSSGDIVEAGQVLVRFDTRQEEASLAAAEAEARMARLTFERRDRLRGSQALSAHDLDRAREESAAATARVESLRIGIEKKTLRAPFRARIGLTDLQPGAYLDAGTRIAMLQGVDANAYVDFSLPQDATSAIGPGATVNLAAPQIPGGTATATIVADDASVDDSSRTVRFRATVSGLGEALRPGTFVDVVAVTSAPQAALFAPLTAVRRAPFGQYVYVLAKEQGQLRARQRIVRTGPVRDGDIAITEGVAEGDLIAAAGSFKLREGILVNIDSPPAQSAQAVAE
ncbi:efflux RND transporter periplasmic adaptor subunit [Sphingosinicella sp.]|uniref:efflux RND transporter periplasmic adaptor subunit n=1 Tax=Sphingosinicella sp. TaxID=1917971 RepID=UPI004037D8A5